MTDRPRAFRLVPVLLVAAVAACDTARTPAPETPAAPAPVVAESAVATARGSFEGRSDHVATGHARIVRSNGQWIVELEEDFFFDGAPDPRVALGRDGYLPEAQLAVLRTDTGQQAYAIPDTLDVADYTEVWLWCERFSVPLGVARLALN
ncbi:MAG: DM13 domain-containing protein [Paracoccaceae bacterium]